MFTIEQIKAAHAKVKSGADFPSYVKEIAILGVKNYECFVEDGRVSYKNEDGREAVAPAKYPVLSVAEKSNPEQFKADLKLHQQGGTDYLTFCSDCAQSGIEKWVVDTVEMTCVYYDKEGNNILLEVIPSV